MSLLLPRPSSIVSRPAPEPSLEARKPPPSLAPSNTSRPKKSPFIPKKRTVKPVQSCSISELEDELAKLSSLLATTNLERTRDVLQKRKDSCSSELELRSARLKLADTHLSPAQSSEVEMKEPGEGAVPPTKTTPTRKVKTIDMVESLALEELTAARERQQQAQFLLKSEPPVGHLLRDSLTRSNADALNSFYFHHDSDDDEDLDTIEELRQLGLDLSANG